MTIVTCAAERFGTSCGRAVSVNRMKRPNLRDGKLFGGFGIFPFSLVLLCVVIPCLAMIHQPHQGQWLSVELPKAMSAHDLRGANREDALKVAVRRDGAMLVNGYKVGNAIELTTRLRLAIAEKSPRRVYFYADRHSKYGTVKIALDAIRDAGVGDISFITEKR